MKVLIVDDSEQIRRMIKRFIRDQVDEFFECADGADALLIYEQHQPDIVLMDIEMKKTGGLEATKTITSAFPDARVVIVSQWESSDLREAATKAGAKDYISKANLLPLRKLLTGKERKK